MEESNSSGGAKKKITSIEMTMQITPPPTASHLKRMIQGSQFLSVLKLGLVVVDTRASFTNHPRGQQCWSSRRWNVKKRVCWRLLHFKGMALGASSSTDATYEFIGSFSFSEHDVEVSCSASQEAGWSQSAFGELSHNKSGRTWNRQRLPPVYSSQAQQLAKVAIKHEGGDEFLGGGAVSASVD
jgi:hypothetical protein